MYTECPECGIAFRVTAKVLQQAKGNVRCGGCNHAFNALEFLSEEMPGSTSADTNDVSDDELAETSRRLLKTLDELAGSSEVRIEDTGVEWRVLEENLDVNDDVDSEASGEMRYDDNTPLPDEFDEVVAIMEEVELAPDDSTDTGLHIEFTESLGEVSLTEPDEWTDLLDEVHQPEPEEAPVEELDEDSPESDDFEELLEDEPLEDESHEDEPLEDEPLEAEANSEDQDAAYDIEKMESEVLQIEEELAAIETQLLNEDGEQDTNGDDDLADIDTQFNLQADALQLHKTGITEASADEDSLPDEPSSLEAEEEEEEPFADQVDTTEEVDADEVEADATTEADADHETDFEEESDFDDEDADVEVTGDAEEETSAEIGDEEQFVDDPSSLDEEESLVAGSESTSEFEAQIEAAANAFAEFDGENEEEEVDEVSEYRADSSDISLDFLALENQVADDDDLDEQIVSTDDDADADEQSGETKHIVPELTEEEMTVNMEIDQEMMAMALQDDEFSATLVGMATPEEFLKDRPKDVEAIIMEGETVHNVVEQERRAAEIAARSQLDDAGDLSDRFLPNPDKLRGGRRNDDPPAIASITVVAILGLILLAQFVHYSRETLATSGFFNQTIGPVYRFFGSPVTPEWDIKGWQFETTNGSIGETDNSLVIVSRLINQSDAALPYPLVHVSLTDRWEDIMGSRILEPGEYLAGALDPSTPVPPGQNFTAVITIDNPAAEATGFKLNVCYRQDPGVVRCAIEDFK